MSGLGDDWTMKMIHTPIPQRTDIPSLSFMPDLPPALLGVGSKGYWVRKMTRERRQLVEALGLEELGLEEGALLPGSVVRALGLSDTDRKALFKSVHCEFVDE